MYNAEFEKPKFFQSVMTNLVTKLEAYCIKKKKELHICGTGGPEDIYMIRYPLFESKPLTIYIHRFLRSDADDHHDHPFNFWSYVVTGGYTEEQLIIADNEDHCDIWGNFHTIASRREPGSLAYRKGTAIHRVIVDKELKYADKDKAPLTVIFLGKRFREWGFWKKFDMGYYGARIFESWDSYLNVNKNSEKARKHQ